MWMLNVVLILGAVPLVSMLLELVPGPIGRGAAWVFLVSLPIWSITAVIFVLTEVVRSLRERFRKRV
jgi:hypothetical protein